MYILYIYIYIYMYISYRCGGSYRTPAAFRLVTQPVVRLFAALAALSLHVGFAAALTGDQSGSNIRHPVTHSSIQRAQRVTVTGYRDTHRTNFKHHCRVIPEDSFIGSSAADRKQV